MASLSWSNDLNKTFLYYFLSINLVKQLKITRELSASNYKLCTNWKKTQVKHIKDILVVITDGER